MHRGPEYICANITPLNRVEAQAFSLTGRQSTVLGDALTVDCLDYLYSSCVSFVGALDGISKGFYSWATVQLYYASFYSIRASLCSYSTCIFYVGKTPFSLIARPGESCVKGKGNTHEFAVKLFAATNVAHPFVSQNIDGFKPVEWLQHNRVLRNYSDSRFIEPDVPRYFESAVQIGIRKLLAAYIRDESDIYTFDRDHAMIALPLAIIGSVLKQIKELKIDDDQLTFVLSRCRDRHGIINDLRKFLLEPRGD